MVHCCVPGCTNYSSKTKDLERPVSYHKIPSEPVLERAWIARLRRENLPPLKNCYVCSEHFEADCFENDLSEQLTGERRKRKLKAGAVPSIFSFPTSGSAGKRARESTENRLKRQRRRETLDNLLAPSTSGIENEPVISIEHSVGISDEVPISVDVGIQCCLDAKYVVMNSVSTQTDGGTNIEKDSTSSSVPDKSVAGMEGNETCASHMDILRDHTYYTPLASVSPKKSIESISPQKSVRSLKSHASSALPFSDSDDEHDDFQLSASQETETSTGTESEEEIPSSEKYVKMPKYLVFDSCLRELFKFCISCGAIVTESTIVCTGSLVTVKTDCLKHHTCIWNSQPIINNTPVGNLLICSSILFTGNTFTRVQNFSSCLGLNFISARAFYKHQDRYLFPVVNDVWEKESSNVIEELSSKDNVKLNGDGRCDSPGHNAKYGTYTFMDSESKKVATFSVVQVTETTSSNAMEKEGFVRCLETLEDEVTIDTITTDRHTSITSSMEKDYSHINHQYDVWHLAKSVVKKLNKKAKTKKCEDLSHWIQSVSNHLWWCAATCNGNVVLLKEKWVSILHHVRNKHSWKDATQFKKCVHPRLSRREAKRKCWLKPGTAAYVALEEVVLQPRLLKDLAKLSDFCHTGGLEVYHSLMLKYCPKRQHFSYKGMVARTQLAAIDNNHNTGRRQAVIKEGERRGEARYNKSFPKMHKRWVVKPVMERKNYDFLPELQKTVLEMCAGTGDIPEPIEEADLPVNIANEAAPDKQELIARHRSRFSR